MATNKTPNKNAGCSNGKKWGDYYRNHVRQNCEYRPLESEAI